jgi:N-acetylglutamate synthase-like GNAT family acetyltransferase
MVGVPLPLKRRKHLTSGSNSLLVRKATADDLDAIKTLADAHRRELGFVRRPALASAINREEVMIAHEQNALVGFVEYHHRRDEQTTVYHVAVDVDRRRCGIGHQLIEALVLEAKEIGKSYIQLKCPSQLEANDFYANVGFSRLGTRSGKNRDLVLWRMDLG